MARRTLYVTGFAPEISARELAYEFEEIGNIYRCDVIPPARSGRQHGYAFVEFEKARDAEYAYRDMHNMRIPTGDVLHVEWAKTPLRETRRRRRSLDRGSAQRRSRNNGDRSRSRSRSPERRSGSPEGGRYRSPDRGRRNDRRDFSDSPEREEMKDFSEEERDERAESRFDQMQQHTPNESDATMVGSGGSVDGKESVSPKKADEGEKEVV